MLGRNSFKLTVLLRKSLNMSELGRNSLEMPMLGRNWFKLTVLLRKGLNCVGED